MKAQKRENIKARIEAEAAGGRLSCPKALAIAAEMHCAPAVVGELCNEMGVKIAGCQLGCFR